MIIVFTKIETPRLEYICDFIFGSVLQKEFQITSDRSFFENSDAIKINYSSEGVDGIQILPQGLLEESGVHKKEFKTGHWDELPVFFVSENSLIPFDLFSAVFFLITRYEEYSASKRDVHDRFLSTDSILNKLDVLQRPIVDLWCQKLNSLLFGTQILSREYKYVSTIDIDNAYAYKYKTSYMKVGSAIKAMLRGDSQDLIRRVGCYFRRKPDPYDTYEFIEKTHQENNVSSMFFFLLSDRNEWDKNLSYTNKYLRALVRKISVGNAVGIHPGYTSYLSSDVILKEKLRLEDILDAKMKSSRQHFLRFRFPETPRNLITAGIKNDYSLCYAEKLGFRGGTCTPFKFYDLEEEMPTALLFHSAAIMDATLNRYMGLNSEEASIEALKVIKEVKAVNGELNTIWHNETLSDIREWKGWRPVFEQVISAAKSK